MPKEAKYREIKTADGKDAVEFTVKTRKGYAHGLYGDGKIWVHGIFGEGSVKGLMNVLVNRFKTNEVVFTPLTNDNIKNSIKGTVKVHKADEPGNPYGEDFEYMECTWKV